ncbi:MAG TPA: hypothetical protein VH331_02475 [Allosphingosinicella sp.]|jgi:hypothetical protein|nr:hypothetical protein [Allosphingosinicella sp.]
MAWFKQLFQRADPEAAQRAIQTAIEAGGQRDLKSIAQETGVSAYTLGCMITDAAIDDLRKRLDEGIRSGTVDLKGLVNRARSLGLPDDRTQQIAEGVIRAHFTALVADVLADGVVSPDEDQRITDFTAMIGGSGLDAASAKLIEEGRQLYRETSGPLAPIEAPVLLQKDEFCVYAVDAEALQERTETSGIGYNGVSANGAFLKGIDYSVGSIDISQHTKEVYRSLGSGTFAMTNKRFLWVGQTQSLSLELGDIVKYVPYVDGIQLFIGTGKPLMFIWTGGSRAPTVMASRVIHELRA